MSLKPEEIVLFKAACRHSTMFNGEDIDPEIISKLLPNRFKYPNFETVHGFIIIGEFFSNNNSGSTIRDVWEPAIKVMNANQVYNYFCKWADRGFYEYGTSPRSGWFDLNKMQDYPEYFKLFVDTCLKDKRNQQFRYKPERIKKFEEYITSEYANWSKEHAI